MRKREKTEAQASGKQTSPWLWIPTLYFVEGLPYFLVNNVSVLMFAKMGVPNGQMALFTSLLYLPWTLKFIWSPFVDILRTKRWWIVTMQLVMAIAFVILGLTLPSPETIAEGQTSMSLFKFTLLLFIVAAFASATHDIAADGFYMLAQSPSSQAAFIGIRNTFYRLANVFGNGVIVGIAGYLETKTGNIPLAWQIAIGGSGLLLTILGLYHNFVMPRPAADVPVNFRSGSLDTKNGLAGDGNDSDVAADGNGLIDREMANSSGTSEEQKPDVPQKAARSSAAGSGASFSDRAKEILMGFGQTVRTYFKKPGVWLAIAFMLCYRLPEALMLKMSSPFLLAGRETGGLGLSTMQVAMAYGVVGVIALLAGGILGGVVASKAGLRKCLWPMAAALALPCLVFVYMSMAMPENFTIVCACVAFDQFGYGFGFTAYTLFMMYFSDGEFKTSHYAFCTCFMALSMMIPGMFAGYLQEWLGYVGFFWTVIVCAIATAVVTFLVHRRLDPSYGKA